MTKASGRDLAAGLEKAQNGSKELSPTSQKLAKRSDEWLPKALAQLAIAMQKELTREEAALYLSKLRDIPVERLKVAFERAIKECEFFPKIAELRKFSEPMEKLPEWQGIQPVKCAVCDDTGFYPLTLVKDGKEIRAVERCRCRKQAS